MNEAAPAPRITITDRKEFVFREVGSVDEMQQVLALRYLVYSDTLGLATRLRSLDHAAQMDLDVHDLTSRHFALFARSNTSEVVVGTLRITDTRPSPMVCALCEIARTHPSLARHMTGEAPVPLPMLSHLSQASAVRNTYEQLVSNGEKIAEPGRLTLDPRLRVAAARTGLKLSHYLIHCALAIGWHRLGLDRVLMDCDVRLEPFYRRFGFVPVIGGDATYQPHLGIQMAVLQATPASLPAALRSDVEALARQLHDTAEAVLQPACGVSVAAHGSRALVLTTPGQGGRHGRGGLKCQMSQWRATPTTSSDE